MSDLIVMPSVITAMREFLIAQPELDSLAGDKVVTRLPTTKAWPIVRLTQFADRPVTVNPQWFGSTTVQVEVFGLNMSNTTVEQLARTCYALLAGRFTGNDELAVTDCNPSGLRDQPDETFSPACPRWLFICEMFGHPVLSSGS